MKKILLLVGALALFSINSFAQTGKDIKLNIAIDGDIPVGSASDAYSFGIGATAKVEVPIASGAYFTANAGFTNMMYSKRVKNLLRDFGENSSGRNFIPLEAGVKYYFTKQFYGEGQIGAAIGAKSGVGTAFAYTPGIGFVLPVSDGNAVDLGFRYESWNKDGSLAFLGLRVAYKFGL